MQAGFLTSAFQPAASTINFPSRRKASPKPQNEHLLQLIIFKILASDFNSPANMSIDGEVRMEDRERSRDERDSPMAEDRPRADERARSRSPIRNRSPAARPRSRSPPPRTHSPPRRYEGGGRNRPERDEGEVNPGNNLYVTNLSLRTRERDLEKLFGEYGKIYKAAVMYDPHNQESRGFAFVSFNNPEDADAARNAISGKVELDGKVITVELAKRGRARTPTPGRYFGPPYKREYDERDGRRGDRYGDRDRGDRYDRYDRYPRGDRYDDRRDRRDDRRDDRRRDRDYDRRY